MPLNCLWYSRKPGQSPEEKLEYKTKVSFNGKYYCYSDDPEKVKRVWEEQEKFKWSQLDNQDGTTTLDAKSNKEKEKLLWIGIAVLCLITFILFMSSSKFSGYGLTQVCLFIYALYNIKNIEAKKNKVPDLEEIKEL